MALPSTLNRLTLLWLLLFTVWGRAQSQSGVYGVFVGVSKYRRSENNLKYCHTDAVEMLETFKLRTPASRLRLLTNEQATRANIIKTAEALFSQAKPEDMVVFFFSGHGNPGVFHAHDQALYLKELQAIFKKARARRKIIFADSCFSGSFRTSSRRQTASDRPDLGKNVMFFLSSRSDQMSLEAGPLRNGLFTYCLTEGLKGGADANRDKKITAVELFNYVNPRVKNSTGGRQVPVMWGRFDKGMVLLNVG